MMLRFNRVLCSPLIHSRMRASFTPSLTQKFTSSTKKFATQQHTNQLPLVSLTTTNNQQRFFSSQTNENKENTENNTNETNTNKQNTKEEDFEAPAFERKTKQDEQQQTKSEGGEKKRDGKKKDGFFKGYFKRFLKGDTGVLVPAFVTPTVLLGLWLLVSKTYDLDSATVFHAIQEMFLEAPRKYLSTMFDNLMNWYSPERRPLLPPIVPEYGRKYTLVIEMETLCDYYKENGVWYLYKRAGVDYFLTNVFRQYEVILYTKEAPGSNLQAIFKLDPSNFYFSSIKYHEMMGMKDHHGHFTDDWEMLRRDPAKIIFLDTGKKKYQHTNTVFIGGAEEGTADSVLIDLVPILRQVEKNNTDIRDIVLQLQTDNPKERIRSWKDHFVSGTPAPKKIVRQEKPVTDIVEGSIADLLLKKTQSPEKKKEEIVEEKDEEEEEKEEKKDNKKKRVQQRK